jgi:hypothetical protein
VLALNDPFIAAQLAERKITIPAPPIDGDDER